MPSVSQAVPTCDPSARPDTCIGVHGVPSWAADAKNQDYIAFINKYDKEQAGDCGGVSVTGVGSIDLWGQCEGSGNTRVASTKPLYAGSADFASLDVAGEKFVATHKVWGSGPSWTHQGVVKENIELGQDDVWVASTGETLEAQNVLLLHFRGDAYDGPVRGLKRGPNGEEQCGSGTRCPTWEYTSDGKRTGAVVGTKENYGPGRYHVRAMVPRTDDVSLDGRGYVFAIWTFHYEEVYKNVKSHPLSPQYVDDAEGFASGSSGDGYYTGHNHEIDIEIPANSPQMENLGWDTMNFNTWIGDNAHYCDNCNVYYQQAQGNAPSGTTFISEDGEYHDYDIEWTTDNNDPSKNTVTWFFDGKEIFSTQKFVPTRAGHLLVGPWPAWWGSNRQPTNFSTATVRIAEISIVPQANHAPLSFSQTYDQQFGSCDLSCDFLPLSGDAPTPSPEPSPGPSPPPCPPAPVPTPSSTCGGASVECASQNDCDSWIAGHGCKAGTYSYCKDNGFCNIHEPSATFV